MHSQTIRTFIGIKDGIVRVLSTDPVFIPEVKRKGGGIGVEDCIESGTEKILHGK